MQSRTAAPEPVLRAVPSLRYQLEIRRKPCRVRVHDQRSDAVLFDWRGSAAVHLLTSGAIPRDLSREGSHGCEKSLVMHLALAAASAHTALPRPHAWVAGILHSYPERHLSEDDVLSIARLEAPNVAAHRVLDCIDDLVRRQLVSRIVVDDEHVFYDIVTEPHLHVFDAGSGELFDAPSEGVIRLA